MQGVGNAISYVINEGWNLYGREKSDTCSTYDSKGDEEKGSAEETSEITVADTNQYSTTIVTDE